MDITTNLNPLAISKASFVMARLPNVTYFSQEVDIPSIRIKVSEQASPFAVIPRPAGKPEFDDFELEFQVDEDMKNYIEIFNWIYALGGVDGFDPYKVLTGGVSSNPPNVFSDGTLIINNSAQVPNIKVTFVDMFPIQLSAITFKTTVSDIEYASCTATFKYQSFKVAKI
jgi:hypothetical protein